MFLVKPGVEQEVDGVDDAGQRIADLVADGGEEPGLGLGGGDSAAVRFLHHLNRLAALGHVGIDAEHAAIGDRNPDDLQRCAIGAFMLDDLVAVGGVANLVQPALGEFPRLFFAFRRAVFALAGKMAD